jgi:hypothetical protein
MRIMADAPSDGGVMTETSARETSTKQATLAFVGRQSPGGVDGRENVI